MYIENTISAAATLSQKWNEQSFKNLRKHFVAGGGVRKSDISEQFISLYEGLSLDERRFLIKIKMYEPLVEAYDNSKSQSGVTRSDVTVLDTRLNSLASFTNAVSQVGLGSAASPIDTENPLIEVTFPIETGKANILNALGTIGKFFKVLNGQKKVLGKTESDLTLELLENRKVKVTFGTTLEYSIVITEIWSSLMSKSSSLEKISKNIENLRVEGISEKALEVVAQEGAEIVSKAIEIAKMSLTELGLNAGGAWETALDQLGRFLEACLSEGYVLKLIISDKQKLSYSNNEQGSLGERAVNLATYSRDRDDANIQGSRKLLPSN